MVALLPALTPIWTLSFPDVNDHPALSLVVSLELVVEPISTFLEPVVREYPASLPIAVLNAPDDTVELYPDLFPKYVLPSPEVLL